ncbi:MAG: hypothetical protein GWN01_13500 [Nitrosopumilaceae archaeon]|nr:hypothetical protein [Nitrosopumilaceae archaeon]NIU88283.1 hypothetical protein [Nitrosopumilaceae archaeon]NIV66575.1 hypothetical protein [Nitrosopumilaceae archaeon]NIX62480.1 hypothetical protein [Nitrosopumilaceae archaeon]
MGKQKEKISVKIDWIVDETGKGGIEVVMNLSDFESSGTSIRRKIRNFKKKYLEAVEKAKKIEKKARTKSKGVSTTERWQACKILADFNTNFTNEFEIKNYKEAFSRDFNLPLRSVRTYIDFGTYFKENEVLDIVPYSIYAEFTFVINELTRKGIFDQEKKQLLKLAKEGNLPKRNEYRKHLRTVTKDSSKTQ